MLTFKNIKENKECISKIKKLYTTSFPENEQVPFVYLRLKAESDISDIFGVYEDDNFIGLLVTLYYKDIVFLWYLAIEHDLRGKGHGSLILNEAAKKYAGYRLILNIEEVENENQQRRKNFYLKNGYRECGFKTMEYGVIYEMLCHDDVVTYEEYKELMINYVGKTMYNRIYKRVF
ncbi:MAG: GNAT family N-acetyltransferase [Erysipelotrichales bacterium]|nr:GNAT family N-acetyltransferase [Erysipelotrichales bacterium]